MTQFIYLMSGRSGYKIGRASDPANRAKSLRTGDPSISVLHSFPAEDAGATESELHESCRFLGFAQEGGEWFRLPDWAVKGFMSIRRAGLYGPGIPEYHFSAHGETFLTVKGGEAMEWPRHRSAQGEHHLHVIIPKRLWHDCTDRAHKRTRVKGSRVPATQIVVEALEAYLS